MENSWNVSSPLISLSSSKIQEGNLRLSIIERNQEMKFSFIQKSKIKNITKIFSHSKRKSHIQIQNSIQEKNQFINQKQKKRKKK
jgi:hypothetical protein